MAARRNHNSGGGVVHAGRAVGNVIGGGLMWLLMVAMFLFSIAVVVAAVLIIVNAFALRTAINRGNQGDIKSASDVIYVSSIILLVALSLNVITMLWRFFYGRSRQY
jgi:hypothetical protein